MIAWTGWLACVVLGVAIEVPAEPLDNPIFPADARLELVFSRTAKLNSGLTEGPALASDGSIYFTDIPFGPDDQTMIQRFDPATNRATLFTAKGGKANGLTFDQFGNLLACDGADGGGRCITRWNIANGKSSLVADRFEGRRFNSPNDLCVDRLGRIYFTDPRYSGSEPRESERQAVYRVEPDGQVVQITDAVHAPNGIVLGPDARTLYVGDHYNGGNRLQPSDPMPPRVSMKVLAFALDKDGLVIGNPRTLVDFGEEMGPDGITVDAAGNLYVSCRSLARPGLLVIDPLGQKLAFLPTGLPNQQGAFEQWRGIPSNVEFGQSSADQNSTWLYVTIDKELYRIASKQLGVVSAAEKDPAK